MTSLACVASTAASSLDVCALWRANKKSVVATSPESSATKEVLNTCPSVGAGGWVTKRSTSQNGSEPKESNKTLLCPPSEYRLHADSRLIVLGNVRPKLEH